MAARRDEAGRGKAARAAASRHTAVDLLALDNLTGDSLGLFCWADERPLVGVAGVVDWRVCGALSQALLSQLFSGALGESLMVPVVGRFGPRRLFVFGLGPAGSWDAGVLRQACREAVATMRRAGAGSVILGAPASRTDTTIEAAFLRIAGEELADQIDQILTEKV